MLLQAKLLSPEFGKHLLEVEYLLQKHKLMEADMVIQAEKVRDVSAAALRFANGDGRYLFSKKNFMTSVSE